MNSLISKIDCFDHHEFSIMNPKSDSVINLNKNLWNILRNNFSNKLTCRPVGLYWSNIYTISISISNFKTWSPKVQYSMRQSKSKGIRPFAYFVLWVQPRIFNVEYNSLVRDSLILWPTTTFTFKFRKWNDL